VPRSYPDRHPPGANVYTLRNGKIIRYKLFQTRTEALAAVGLAE
jgi:hypothetical protein